jgi:hypothetical protein
MGEWGDHNRTIADHGKGLPCNMHNIRQGQLFAGHTRMETFQVHCQTTEEVYTHGKPSQTQVI